MAGDPSPIDLIGGIDSTDDVSKSDMRAHLKARIRLRMTDADEARATDLSEHFGIDVGGSPFDRDTDELGEDDGVTIIRDANGVAYVLQSTPTGVTADDAGTFAERAAHDNAAGGFIYLSIDGDGALIDDPVLFVKLSNTSGDWSSALEIRGPQGGDRYELGNWDSDRPASGEELLSWLVTTIVTFPAALLGSQAKARVASTGTAVYSIQKNDVQIATLTFTASTTGVFAMASQTTFAAGDRLSVIAPNPRDATLSGVVMTLVASR